MARIITIKQRDDFKREFLRAKNELGSGYMQLLKFHYPNLKFNNHVIYNCIRGKSINDDLLSKMQNLIVLKNKNKNGYTK